MTKTVIVRFLKKKGNKNHLACKYCKLQLGAFMSIVGLMRSLPIYIAVAG